MKAITVLTFAMLALLPLCSQAKVFGRCELAKVLRDTYGMDRVADWICLVHGESSFRTDAKGGPNSDGSYDFGLFQINNHYWCSPGQYDMCHVACTALLDDDISNDVACAKLILGQQGFSAWTAWKRDCQNQDVSHWIQGCF